MLRFIDKTIGIVIRLYEFQYISCYGLSIIRNKEDYEQAHFNTSHVTVYRCGAASDPGDHGYFNTSHVTVYLPDQSRIVIENAYFNTSHVTVYQEKRNQVGKINHHFNTSHVTVYLYRVWW